MDTLARALERSSRVKENIAFYSDKSKSLQYCESRVEAYACYLREFDDDITDYVNQPTSIFYQRSNKLLRYTPDALVRYRNGDVNFEEVKPISKAITAEFADKFQFLQQYFESHLNVPLALNTAQTDSLGFRYCNYEILYPHLMQSKRNKLTHVYEDVAESLPKRLLLSELAAKCEQFHFSQDIAFEMIATGMYSFCKTKFLCGNSELELLND